MQTPAPSRAERALRVTLGLAALLIAYLGVDNALGGIASLGLQGPTDFFTVTNPRAFEIRDSHVRFLGGIWLGVAFVFMSAAVQFRPMRQAVATVCGLVFVGGLARFSAMNLGALAAHGLAPALLAELVLLPILGVWAFRTRPAPAPSAQAPAHAVPA